MNYSFNIKRILLSIIIILYSSCSKQDSIDDNELITVVLEEPNIDFPTMKINTSLRSPNLDDYCYLVTLLCTM